MIKLSQTKFSKFIVMFVILLNVVFTAAILYIFARDGQEPSTLIGAWFAFTTGELWALSKIKRDESEKEKNNKGGEYNVGDNY